MSDFDRIIRQTSSPWYLQPKQQSTTESPPVEFHPSLLPLERKGLLSGVQTGFHRRRNSSHEADSDNTISRHINQCYRHPDKSERTKRKINERDRHIVSSSTSTSGCSDDEDRRRKHYERYAQGFKKYSSVKKNESKHGTNSNLRCILLLYCCPKSIRC